MSDNGFEAVIVAAGQGTRLGQPTPKAFIPLAGKPLLLHGLERFDAHPLCQRLVLVVSQPMAATAEQLCLAAGFCRPWTIVEGGAERWQSVANGVSACQAPWVMVHDAARPFVSAAVIDSLLSKKDAFGCVITATPEVDTIRRFEQDRCSGTVDRATLIRVGTPQLFHRATLLQAFAKAASLTPPPTDEAMLFEALGHHVGFAWGDPLNFKVTTPADLQIAEALCAHHKP